MMQAVDQKVMEPMKVQFRFDATGRKPEKIRLCCKVRCLPHCASPKKRLSLIYPLAQQFYLTVFRNLSLYDRRLDTGGSEPSAKWDLSVTH